MGKTKVLVSGAEGEVTESKIDLYMAFVGSEYWQIQCCV